MSHASEALRKLSEAKALTERLGSIGSEYAAIEDQKGAVFDIARRALQEDQKMLIERREAVLHAATESVRKGFETVSDERGFGAKLDSLTNVSAGDLEKLAKALDRVEKKGVLQR